MKKVNVYESTGGVLEKNIIRAYAWELFELMNGSRPNEKISFSGALEIIKESERVSKLLEEYQVAVAEECQVANGK